MLHALAFSRTRAGQQICDPSVPECASHCSRRILGQFIRGSGFISCRMVSLAIVRCALKDARLYEFAMGADVMFLRVPIGMWALGRPGGRQGHIRAGG